MNRTSRFALLIATITLPLIAACSESPTAPGTLQVRRDGGDSTGLDSTALCRDHQPWGRCGA